VLPALIRRYDEAAKAGSDTVTNWGTGKPRREFLHVDDMAAACLHLLENYDGAQHVNVGTGIDVSISELASIVAEAVGFTGSIEWDTSKPDGTPRKLLDVSKLSNIGWKARIPLHAGIASTVGWYRSNIGHVRS
jgi:GDP-L-fucose synthase